MSLINQVLNDLEKRGTNAAARTDAVRAVPPAAGRHLPVVWMAIGTLLAAMLGGAVWKSLHRAPTPPVAAPRTARPMAAVPRPASQPKPQPADVVAAQQPKEHAVPSLSLSTELSSIPPPSGTQPERHQAPAKHHQAPIRRQAHVPMEKTRVPLPTVEAQEGYGGPSVKHISPQQQAQDEFGQAVALIRQGRKSEALSPLETALQLDPDNTEARRTLAGLLLEGRRNAEAERILQDGLRLDPEQSSLAMLLARLQVERGALPQALETLQTTLPFADQKADYHAFVAAVLQRLDRHREAITQYQIALHLSPDSAVWWMGLGISFQAVDDDEDARNAYKHAIGLHQLNAELLAFVEKRLQALTVPAK
jgi:MSHA biogenesis protein MshN